MLKHIISTTSLAILLPMSFAAAQTLSTRANVPQEPPTIPRQAVRPEVPTTRPPALTNHIPLNRPMPRLPERPVVPRTLNERGGVDTGGGDLVTVGGRQSLLDLMESDVVEWVDLKTGTVMNSQGNFVHIPYERYINLYSSEPLVFAVGYGILRNGLFAGDTYVATHPLKNEALFSLTLAQCLGETYFQNEHSAPGRAARSYNLGVQPLRWGFVEEALPNIRDEGVINLGDANYELTQLAVQERGIVLINKPSFSALPTYAQEMLRIHEGILCAVMQLNPQHLEQRGTSHVRRLTRHLFQRALNQNPSFASSFNVPLPPPLPEEVLRESYTALGLPAFLEPRELVNRDHIAITMSGYKGMPGPVITFTTYDGSGTTYQTVNFNQDMEPAMTGVCTAKVRSRTRGRPSQRNITACISDLNRWMTNNRASIQASWDAYAQE